MGNDHFEDLYASQMGRKRSRHGVVDTEPQPVTLTGTICGEGCPAWKRRPGDCDRCHACYDGWAPSPAPTGRECIWPGGQP